MKLERLVAAAGRVAATSKRSEKVSELAAVLAELAGSDRDDGEIETAIGLLLGSPRQGRLGIGWAALAGLADVRARPADVATLEVADVDRALSRLAALQGAGSQRERATQVAELFSAATEPEQHFLHRVFAGDMRQGANDGVVTDAVAKASRMPLATVRRAAMLLGDLGTAARRALSGDDLEAIGLTPLVGVQPMLASTAATVTEALGETGPASVEWKLDGARIQVHRTDDSIRVFTRTLHEISARVPEIVRAALELPATEFVLDGEALGLDADGNPLKFQDTMNAETHLRPFFFDALQASGHSLIDLPLIERKAALAELVPDALRLPTLDTDDPVAAEQFAAASIAAGHEGVMVKALTSPYQAGRRGATWRKVKPVHTLDLVVLAAEWGHGRRTGWLSNLHLGARGDDGTFVMVGKTFKGLTDELLRWQTETFPQYALGEGADDGAYVLYMRPELVVEIALDGVQRSTRYPGGVALRFARVRRYRGDKTAAEADTIERVQAML
ncbi:MAG: ATP-dependent ligase [Ilumatobacteraceae bacterium]|nr:ATP-dependent ligase [Ilumatobacteraceae bacterium]